jgi:hypothetical protein
LRNAEPGLAGEGAELFMGFRRERGGGTGSLNPLDVLGRP